ncbi:MAG TPA: hypothetical protein VIX12_08670, partial [Candidatus Binataceae bacterium]
MSKPHYKAVVLDLFDTIVNWDGSLLPVVVWRGRELRNTAPLLFPTLEAELGESFSRDAFLDGHYGVYEEIFAQRAVDEPLEITCLQRYARTLERLGLEHGDIGRLAEKLRGLHMSQVRAVTSAPAHRVEAVRRLAHQFRLGLLSNFDDTSTGHQIMDDTGLRNLFEVIIISAEVGLRKP